MSDTSLVPDTDQARIAARYPRPGRRRFVLPLALVLSLAVAAWVLWAGLYRANPGITGQLHGYRVVDATQVEVTVVVHRPNPQVAGLCVVQAQAASGEIVGELSIPVAPGRDQDTTHRTTVKTYLRATTAIVKQCHTV